MKKEDFILISREHFESCETIIKHGGSCENVECENCPFTAKNSTLKIRSCCNKYSGEIAAENKDKKLLNSAEKFLKTFN